jgi:hypothetical protein
MLREQFFCNVEIKKNFANKKMFTFITSLFTKTIALWQQQWEHQNL